MTYGLDAQPDILFQGDGLKRGLHRMQSRVNCIARQIRFELARIRRLDDPVQIRASREWIADAWGARREAQQSVIAHRNLIEERNAAGTFFPAPPTQRR